MRHSEYRSLLKMPKRRKQDRGWQRRNKHKPTPRKHEDGVRGAGYTPIVKENERFVKYYQGLGVVPGDEWDKFMAIMRQPLPSTFRITGTQHLATAVRECLQHSFFSQLTEAVKQGIGENEEGLTPPKPLPWYPNNLAWHIPLSKAFIRKSPEVSKFHRFLVDESDQGNISRQEAVSMIPPLLLDVQPHHKVLDMCAAPGSKTAQLIEMIHADDGGSPSASSLPAGVVIANDADNRRCYMLVHQAKRLKSSCFMVTNHDASVFPMLYYHDENDVRHPLHYDRVLCDVPCSGDGTMRKNPTIWRSWNPTLGAALHKLQLRILNRGLELLQPGGRLVYSTCSLNPLENEAVITTILQLCKGSIELIDVSDQLPGLKTIQGMTSWKVMNKKLEWITQDSSSSSTASTLFPPDPSLLPQLNLHRCVRVLPHHQDTGGFFIAVLHKSIWLPWQRRPQRAKGSDDTRTVDSSNCEESHRPSVLVAETQDDRDNNDRSEVIESSEGGGDKDEERGSRGVENEEREEEDREAKGGGEGDREGEDGRETDEDREGKTEKEIEKEFEVDTTVGLEASVSETETITATISEEANLKAATKEDVDEELTSDIMESGVSGDVTAGQEIDPTPEKRPNNDILGRAGHRQSNRGRVYKEDPYVFVTEDSPVWKLIKPYYGLSDTFPSNQLLTRTMTGKKRNIYLTSALVRDLLRRNELHVKFINVGVKVLARCDNYNASCPFRLCQEGIESLIPFITKSRLSLTLNDLVLVLQEPNPLSTQLSPQTQEALASLGVGPALFDYIPDNSKEMASTLYNHPIYLSGWIAHRSVRLYVDKKYRCHYLAMLGHEPPQSMSLASVSGKKDNEKADMEEWSKQEEERGKSHGEEEERIMMVEEEEGDGQGVEQGEVDMKNEQ